VTGERFALISTLLAADAFELLRRLFDSHELAALLVALGRRASEFVLQLSAFLDRALPSIVADRLVYCHHHLPLQADG
jgi:hypothetical protein